MQQYLYSMNATKGEKGDFSPFSYLQTFYKASNIVSCAALDTFNKVCYTTPSYIKAIFLIQQLNKEQRMQDQTRREVMTALQNAISKRNDLILSMVTEELFCLLLQLPWEQMSSQRWATVYHNHTHWVLPFELDTKNVGVIPPASELQSLTDSIGALGKHALCSVTSLEEDLTEQGMAVPAEVEDAKTAAMEVYRFAGGVKLVACGAI